MKALVSQTPGGPETLRIAELPDPAPGPGELLIAVAACGLNYPDVLVIEDLYQFKPERPFAPGSEISGTVVAVGEGVTGWKPGDRAMATMLGSGGLAEKAVVKAIAAFHLPASHDLVQASALLLTYGTVLHALADRGRLREGETVLVLGASGGIGIAAIQVARAMGARVVAAVSTEEKARIASEAGADETVVYPSAVESPDEQRALAGQFKQALGSHGADVILDPVGGGYAEPALRAIAWRGRFLVVGFPAGIPRLPLNLVLLKGCDVAGVFYGDFAQREPQENAGTVQQLLDWWGEGRLAPQVTAVYPLERAGEAITLMKERKVVGKLVVKVAD